jgi:hypothetical protein
LGNVTINASNAINASSGYLLQLSYVANNGENINVAATTATSVTNPLTVAFAESSLPASYSVSVINNGTIEITNSNVTTVLAAPKLLFGQMFYIFPRTSTGSGVNITEWLDSTSNPTWQITTIGHTFYTLSNKSLKIPATNFTLLANGTTNIQATIKGTGAREVFSYIYLSGPQFST